MLKKMRRIGITIDMTPMVDIMFLLLIFFMATTQFKPPEQDKVTLPESGSEAKAPESDIITIAVTAPKPENAMQSTVRVIYRARGEEQSEVLLPEEQPVLVIPATSVLSAPYGDSVYVVEPKAATNQGPAQLMVRHGASGPGVCSRVVSEIRESVQSRLPLPSTVLKQRDFPPLPVTTFQ